MIVKLLIAVFFVGGLFILWGINPVTVMKEIQQKIANKPPTMQQLVLEAQGREKHNFIGRQFISAKETLDFIDQGNRYPAITRLSMILALCGAVIGLLLENVLLLPLLALLGMMLPFVYLRFYASSYRRESSEELKTSMSIITSSYLRTEDLISSINENIPYLHDPMQTIFKRFIAKTQWINGNIDSALRELKRAVKNDVFSDWCEALIECQRDHTMKNMLIPILQRLSNVETVQIKLDTKLFTPAKSFVGMILLVLVNFPIVFFLNRQWFEYLFVSTIGKIALSAVAGALLFSAFAIMRATRPLVYRR